MTPRALLAATMLTVAPFAPATGRAADLYLCEVPDIAGTTAAWDVTPDGAVVVGVSNGRAFRWTEAGGVELLSPPDWLHTHTAGVSDDGSVVVSTVADGLGVFSAARWLEGSGWQNLGGLPGEDPLNDAFGSGYDVSGDGAVVVGLAWRAGWKAEAFRWDADAGMVGLGRPVDRSSRSTAISADGRVIGGFYESESAGYRRPARWVDGGPVDLFLGEETGGEVVDLSSGGGLVVGQYAPPDVEAMGFLYSNRIGLTPLPPILDGESQGSLANGVSDQSVVVGWSGNPYSGAIEASIWLPGDERMRSLEGYLTDLGVEVPDGVILTTAVAVSADGTTIVGQATSPDLPPGSYTFFVATVPVFGLFADGFEAGTTAAWSGQNGRL